MLTAELPVATLDRDALGVALARLVTVCDLLLDESLKWLFPGAKVAPTPKRPSRHGALLARYADRLGELAAPDRRTPGRRAIDRTVRYGVSSGPSTSDAQPGAHGHAP